MTNKNREQFVLEDWCFDFIAKAKLNLKATALAAKIKVGDVRLE
jgi:hypothetical protein